MEEKETVCYFVCENWIKDNLGWIKIGKFKQFGSAIEFMELIQETNKDKEDVKYRVIKKTFNPKIKDQFDEEEIDENKLSYASRI